MKAISEHYTIIRDRFMQNVLDSLLDCYRYFGWDGQGKPPILIHTLFDIDPTMDELIVMQKYFRNQGHVCEVVQPGECSYENGKLYANGTVYEKMNQLLREHIGENLETREPRDSGDIDNSESQRGVNPELVDKLKALGYM